MGGWHEVNASSGCFGLVIVSLFEADVNALFAEATKTLLVLLVRAFIACLLRLACMLGSFEEDQRCGAHG